MNRRHKFVAALLTISCLMLVSPAVLLSQTQPQTQAQTQQQTKAQTQPQSNAQTQPQAKTQTQLQTKAQTQQPVQQRQKVVPDTLKKPEKRTINGKSYSGRCQAITKDGTRCTRKALPGSKYCRLHGGK